MRICDLKEKEVINVCDGRRLGFVEDVEFDLCSGCITHIIVPGPCKFLGFYRTGRRVCDWIMSYMSGRM